MSDAGQEYRLVAQAHRRNLLRILTQLMHGRYTAGEAVDAIVALETLTGDLFEV